MEWCHSRLHVDKSVVPDSRYYTSKHCERHHKHNKSHPTQHFLSVSSSDKSPFKLFHYQKCCAIKHIIWLILRIQAPMVAITSAEPRPNSCEVFIISLESCEQLVDCLQTKSLLCAIGLRSWKNLLPSKYLWILGYSQIESESCSKFFSWLSTAICAD